MHLISEICALARPVNRARYERYLGTLTTQQLERRLLDLREEAGRPPTGRGNYAGIRFLRPALTPAANGGETQQPAGAGPINERIEHEKWQ